MTGSENAARCISGPKCTWFMARSHFSVTTAAIKTLKCTISGSELCIMTELCLIIRGEEKNSVETKGAEISAAARPARSSSTLPE